MPNHENQGLLLGGFTERPSARFRATACRARAGWPTTPLTDGLSVFVQVLAVGFRLLEGHLDEQVNDFDYRVDAVVVAVGNLSFQVEEQIGQLVGLFRVAADYCRDNPLSAGAGQRSAVWEICKGTILTIRSCWYTHTVLSGTRKHV
jgi:hypothetical protein